MLHQLVLYVRQEIELTSIIICISLTRRDTDLMKSSSGPHQQGPGQMAVQNMNSAPGSEK